MKKLIILFAIFAGFNASAQYISQFSPLSQYSPGNLMIVEDTLSPDTATHKSTVRAFIAGYNLATVDTLLDVKDTTPSTGNTVQGKHYKHLMIYQTGTLSALTVNLPPGPRNGQEFTISSKVTVTTLTITGGTTVTTYTTLAPAMPIRLKYDYVNGLWYNN